MQVRIFDKHESTDEQEMYTSYMVLGVHSFSHFLADFSHKKNLKIFIQGKLLQVTQNILWNQYFSYTLLKDIDKTIFAQSQHQKSFMKIGNNTYKLSECLEWQQFLKIQNEVARNHRFCLESFMADSSIKFITIQIGPQRNRHDFDLEFVYMAHSLSLSSFSLNSNKKAETYSIGSKSTNKNASVKQNMMDKNFEKVHREQRNSSSIKYSTEKKVNLNQSKRGKMQTCSKKQEIKMKKTYPSEWKESKNQAYSSKLSGYNFATNSTGPFVESDFSKKQNIAASILHRKEEKLKQYMNLLEQKQKEYEQKISRTEAQHEEEVSQIKKQVQQVLSSYKKKNKNLRKQNQCLSQMNKNLEVANQKLEETMGFLSAQMQSLKQKQKILENNNLEYRVKLENIQKANIQLNDKLDKQESMFKFEVGEKNKMVTQLKTKYNKLMGSIKNMAVEEDKENMG